MRPHKWTYIAASLLLMSVTGCRPLYRASIPNQPMLTEKRQLDAKIGLETGTGYFNATYALTNHVLLTAGGNAWSNRNTTARFGESGIGVFGFDEKSKFGWSTLLTTGFGYASVIDDVGIFEFPDNDGNPIQYQAQYIRTSIQPGFYIAGNAFDLGFALRASGVNWLSPDIYRDQRVQGLEIYFDPVLTLQAGTEAVKFFLETSLTIPTVRTFNHPINPVHLGLGMTFTISRRALGLPSKEKPNEQ